MSDHLNTLQEDTKLHVLLAFQLSHAKKNRLSVYYLLKWDSHGVAPLDTGINTRDTLDDTNMSSPFQPGNRSASRLLYSFSNVCRDFNICFPQNILDQGDIQMRD